MDKDHLDSKMCEVVALFMAAMILAGTALRPVFNEQHYLFTVLGSMNFVLAVACYCLIKTQKVTHYAAPMVVIVNFLCLTPLLLISGGIHSQFTYLMPLIPVFTCLFANWKVVLTTSIALISLILFMHFNMPLFSDIDSGIHTSQSKLIAKTFWLVIATMISACFGYYHRAQNHMIKTLLHKHAYIDPLTGIGNRRFIEDQLKKAQEETLKERKSLGVMVLDIDKFKHFNDNFGHETGDTVLKSVAVTLSAHIRTLDKIGRFGGEEFLIILPDISEEDFEKMGRRLVGIIEAMQVTQEDIRHKVTVSIGGYWEKRPSHFNTSRLIKLADTALYNAKGSGRNQFIAYA